MRSRTVLASFAFLSLVTTLAAGASLVACGGSDSATPTTDAGKGVTADDGGADDAGTFDASDAPDAAPDGDASVGDANIGDASDGATATDGGNASDASDASSGDGGDGSTSASSLAPGANEILGILPDNAIIYRDANGVSALLPFQAGTLPIATYAYGTDVLVNVYGSTVLVTDTSTLDAGPCGALERVRTWSEAGGFTEIAPAAYSAVASNDGATLAFTTTDATCTAHTINVSKADGSGTASVASSPPCTPTLAVVGRSVQADYACDYTHAYVYSGAALATKTVFTSRGATLDPTGTYAVARVSDQVGFYRVADGTPVAGDATWTQAYPDPTGTYAAVQHTDGSMTRVTYASPSTPTTLVGAPGFVGGPLFSPDGTEIAFSDPLNADGGLPVSLVKSDGSSVPVQAFASAQPLFFSADSRYLLVTDRNNASALTWIPVAGAGTATPHASIVQGSASVVRGSLILEGSAGKATAGLALIDLTGASAPLDISAAPVSALLVSPSGYLVAYLGSDGLYAADLP